MASGGGKSKGPPPAVKKLLGLFGSQREEDRMVGYLSFLKLGPKILKFLPGKDKSLIMIETHAWSCTCDGPNTDIPPS